MVSGTLVVLVGFGVARRYVAPLIPPPNEATSSESADYLRQGESQAIPWRALSADLVAEARRRHRPILLALGSESSPVARDLDARAFADTELVQQVLERYIPARLDLALDPAWRGVLAPLGRTAAFRDEGLQLVVLTPTGRPVVSIAPPALGLRFDRDSLAAFLTEAQERLDSGEEPTPTETALAGERTALAGDRREIPAPDAALSLRARIEPDTGLVTVSGGARLSPWALDAIARAGEVPFVREALSALAASSMQDPLDGGVFIWRANVGRTGIPGRRIECTKGLLLNGALAETTARVAVATGDQGLVRFARRTADWCRRRLDQNSPAFVVSDQGLNDLSPYYSLTLRRLRAAGLTSDDAAFQARLGAADDPQALGRLAGPVPRIVGGDLARLARSETRPPERNPGIPTVEAITIARLLRTARLLDDAQEAAALGGRLDRLENTIDRSQADLALLLALADAHFADFLANGRAEGLDLAARDLDRAIHRYGSSSGALSAGEGLAGLTISPEAPDLADGDREGTAAVAIRLANAVGRALDTTAEGRRLRRWARACAGRYPPVIGTDADHPNGAVTPECAAFFAACAEVSTPTWLVVAGSDPVRGANEALRRDPYRLVVPTIGAAAPGVPRGAEGVVVRQDDAS